MAWIDSIVLDKGIARVKDLMRSVPKQVHIEYEDAVLAFDANGRKDAPLVKEVQNNKTRCSMK